MSKKKLLTIASILLSITVPCACLGQLKSLAESKLVITKMVPLTSTNPYYNEKGTILKPKPPKPKPKPKPPVTVRKKKRKRTFFDPMHDPFNDGGMFGSPSKPKPYHSGNFAGSFGFGDSDFNDPFQDDFDFRDIGAGKHTGFKSSHHGARHGVTLLTSSEHKGK